jgi:hypothetical protein
LVYIPNTFAQSKAFLLGQDQGVEPRAEGPVPLSFSTAEGAQPQGVAPEKIQTTQPNQQSNTTTLTPERLTAQGNEGGAIQQMFQPLSQQKAQVGQQLGGTVQKFYQEAGPQRTYESSGAQGLLGTAIAGTPDLAEQQKRMGEAKGLVNAQYTGPGQLAQTDVDTIQKGLQESAARRQVLQAGGAGISTLLEQYMPQLSAGQRKYEAGLMSQSPEFQKQRQQYIEESQALQGQSAAEQQKAQEFAQERTTKEAEIASKSKEYLTGRQTEISQQLQDTINQKNTEDAAARAAYDQFLKTGSQEDWAKIPKNFFGTYTPEGTGVGEYQPQTQITAQTFNTDARKNLAQAQQWYNKIVNTEFAQIKDVPLLQVRIDGQGRETWDFTQKDASGKETVDQKGSQLTDKQRNMAIQRQQRLQDAGFSPGTNREIRGQSETAQRGKATTKLVGGEMVQMTPAEQQGENAYGKFATAMPLYYAEGGPTGAKWTPADLRTYTVWHPGVSPSRENVSTETQRGIYNNISDLMDFADKLVEAGEPWKAAQVGADVNKFLKDEESVLTQRKDILSKSATDWNKLVNKARKKYNESSGFWGQLAKVVMDVTTLGGVLPSSIGSAAIGALTMGAGMGLMPLAMGSSMAPIGGAIGGGLEGAAIGYGIQEMGNKPMGEQKETKTKEVKSQY